MINPFPQCKVDYAIFTSILSDGITLKRIQFDHQRQQVLLHPFNADYRVQVVDSLQGDEIYLIGVMVMQMRLTNTGERNELFY